MRKSVVVVLGLMLMVVAGCSKAPVEEEKRAIDALDLAREAEADVYAPDAFAAAQDTLDAGIKERQRQDEKFKLFRSYGKARDRFLRAEELAQRATEIAGDVKNQQADDCRRASERATAAVDSCADLLDKAPKAKGTRPDLRALREDLKSLGSELGTVNDYLDNRRYIDCISKADGNP
jgi:hypothetical protein